MTQVNFSFKVEGVEVLQRQFRGINDSIDDLSDGFRAALQPFRNAVEDNFQSSNATGRSGTWKPLSEKTIASNRRKIGFLADINIERLSDKLYKSLTREGADGSVVQIDKKQAAFGTDVKYARAQHFGYAARNLPARPLIDLTDAQLQTVSSAMRSAIVKKVKRETTLVIKDTDFLSDPQSFF